MAKAAKPHVGLVSKKIAVKTKKGVVYQTRKVRADHGKPKQVQPRGGKGPGVGKLASAAGGKLYSMAGHVGSAVKTAAKIGGGLLAVGAVGGLIAGAALARRGKTASVWQGSVGHSGNATSERGSVWKGSAAYQQHAVIQKKASGVKTYQPGSYGYANPGWGHRAPARSGGYGAAGGAGYAR